MGDNLGYGNMLSLWNLCRIHGTIRGFNLCFNKPLAKQLLLLTTWYNLILRRRCLHGIGTSLNGSWESNPFSTFKMACDNLLLFFSSYLVMSNDWERFIHFKINELIFHKQLLISIPSHLPWSTVKIQKWSSTDFYQIYKYKSTTL